METPFRNLTPEGSAIGYLNALGARAAAAMETLLEGDPYEQARAKEHLMACTGEYDLARWFDREYFERVGFFGHTQALEQVSSELEAEVVHHFPGDADALLEALQGIRTAYDAEGRSPIAGAPSSSSG